MILQLNQSGSIYRKSAFSLPFYSYFLQKTTKYRFKLQKEVKIALMRVIHDLQGCRPAPAICCKNFEFTTLKIVCSFTQIVYVELVSC